MKHDWGIRPVVSGHFQFSRDGITIGTVAPRSHVPGKTSAAGTEHQHQRLGVVSHALAGEILARESPDCRRDNRMWMIAALIATGLCLLHWNSNDVLRGKIRNAI